MDAPEIPWCEYIPRGCCLKKQNKTNKRQNKKQGVQKIKIYIIGYFIFPKQCHSNYNKLLIINNTAAIVLICTVFNTDPPLH